MVLIGSQVDFRMVEIAVITIMIGLAIGPRRITPRVRLSRVFLTLLSRE